MAKGVPKLTELAGRAEEIVYAMPPEKREQALVGVRQIFIGAKSLTVLPDELISVLWQGLMQFVMRSVVPGAKKRPLVVQILNGAPRMLGSIRHEIEGRDDID